MDEDLSLAFQRLDEAVTSLHQNHGFHVLGLAYRPAQMSPLGLTAGMRKELNLGDPLVLRGVLDLLAESEVFDLEEAEVSED